MLWIEYALFGMILLGGFVFTRASELLMVGLFVAFIAAWLFDRQPSRDRD
jgi:hypothetical protein